MIRGRKGSVLVGIIMGFLAAGAFTSLAANSQPGAQKTGEGTAAEAPKAADSGQRGGAGPGEAGRAEGEPGEEKAAADAGQWAAERNSMAIAAYNRLLADREKDEDGSFYLLDINQDGVEELLYSRAPGGYMGYLEIYAYSNGSLVSDDIWYSIGSITYKTNEKALLVESSMQSEFKKSVFTFDGASLNHDYAAFSRLFEISPTEDLLPYGEFRIRMLRYDGGNTYTDEGARRSYENYVDEWNAMQQLAMNYHCWQEEEGDITDIMLQGTENTARNRRDFLR